MNYIKIIEKVKVENMGLNRKRKFTMKKGKNKSFLDIIINSSFKGFILKL